MKRIALLIVFSTICAFAGCKKEIIHSDPPKQKRNNVGAVSMRGSLSAYESVQDSIYFRTGKGYKLFVVETDGSISYYRWYRKGQDLYECKSNWYTNVCNTIDENGVVVSKENFDKHEKTEYSLNAQLLEIYKKAKADCKE